MNPLTEYAKSKVNLEKALSQLADSDFSPVYMRNGTAFGISPSMRFDLVVNNLMGWAFTTKSIKILSDGRSWRPIVHIKDISNAFSAVLKAQREDIHDSAFNVGMNSENYQVKTMAEKIKSVMKDCEIKILGENNPDVRNYIVNFDKISSRLKDFKPRWTIEEGVKEIYQKFNDIELSEQSFNDRHFTRIKQLKFLLENNNINEELHWN